VATDSDESMETPAPSFTLKERLAKEMSKDMKSNKRPKNRPNSNLKDALKVVYVEKWQFLRHTTSASIRIHEKRETYQR
jgi:hypothetical protein